MLAKVTTSIDKPLVTGLDHVGVVAADIDRAAASFEAIGFALTPLSVHSGSVVPGGAVVPFGTGNRCAMFGVGYLELISIVDLSRHCGVYPALLEQYEGLHILALSTPDPKKYEAALKSRGVAVDGVFELTRQVESGRATDRARFTIVRVSRSYAPEARIIGVRHETPELLWRPSALTHPNGARRLSFVTTVVADIAEARERFSAILGLEPRRSGDALRFELDAGTVEVCTPQYARRMYEVNAPCLPFNAAFGVRVSRLDLVRQILRRNGIPFFDKDQRLIVGPKFLCGAACVFELD